MRLKIVPTAKSYPIEKLMAALDYFIANCKVLGFDWVILRTSFNLSRIS